MGAVRWAAAQRLTRRWRALVAIGVVLGIGFGLSLAALATARHTASAYGRVLEAAQAEDASIFHFQAPDEVADTFGALDGVVGQHPRVGFVGTFDGIDPALTRAILAPVGEPFPIERPTLRDGRLPHPDEPAEIFVNAFLADEAGLDVGSRIDLNLQGRSSPEVVAQKELVIVGIGTLPREAVVDQTAESGLVIVTDAFYEANREHAAYAATGVDLAEGVDARRDLAPQLAEIGFEIQEARDQEAQLVNDALRPLVVILSGLGILGLAATTLVSAQLLNREQDRWRSDDDVLRTLGMARGEVVVLALASGAVVAASAGAVAAAALLLVSPVSPVGPLHRLDPGKGRHLDLTVLAGGLAWICASTAALAAAFAWGRSRRAAVQHPDRLTPLSALAQRPASIAGVTLSLGGRERAGTSRVLVTTTAAVALAAAVTTVVAAAVSLSSTPARYGFDWDLLAVSQFGDQPEAALRSAFGSDPDVAAATGFTTVSYLIRDQAVPGLVSTSIKSDVQPTLLRGARLRGSGEIVLGSETASVIGADVGDTVLVQLTGSDGEPVSTPTELEVVGIAAFPPVAEIGSDQPRLGIGGLVTRDAYTAMGGPPDDLPEWTAIRVVEGADPSAIVARNPEGVPDAHGTPTVWFDDAKPAELRQLDSVRPLLNGAVGVSAAIALAVAGHGLWSATRARRRPLAILRTLGFTRRQLAETAAWQALPVALLGGLVGLPVGIAAGRWAFSTFARTLAVVDATSTAPVVVAALVLCAVAAAGVGAAAAVAVALRLRPSSLLRSE